MTENKPVRKRKLSGERVEDLAPPASQDPRGGVQLHGSDFNAIHGSDFNAIHGSDFNAIHGSDFNGPQSESKK